MPFPLQWALSLDSWVKGNPYFLKLLLFPPARISTTLIIKQCPLWSIKYFRCIWDALIIQIWYTGGWRMINAKQISPGIVTLAVCKAGFYWALPRGCERKFYWGRSTEDRKYVNSFLRPFGEGCWLSVCCLSIPPKHLLSFSDMEILECSPWFLDSCFPT